MHSILSQIEESARAVQAHPFLLWLGDPATPARERLSAWLQSAAPFVFGFMDLNAEVLRYPGATAARDPLEHAINQHLVEDATHWPWYLQDLQVLGLDPAMTFTQALRKMWGKDTAGQRRAVYQLCALAEHARSPVLRYSMVMALEAVAHRLFAVLLEVSREFESETGTALRYLGPQHFAREPGHLMHQPDAADAMFAALTIDDEVRAEALRIAAAVIAIVEARWHEFHRNALVRGTSPALQNA